MSKPKDTVKAAGKNPSFLLVLCNLLDGSNNRDYMPEASYGRYTWQRVWETRVGTVVQNNPETVTKHYVVDYLSVANRDILVTEDGSYIQRYVYDSSGDRKIAEFSYAEGTLRGEQGLSVGEPGENMSSDFAAAKIQVITYRTNLTSTSLIAVDTDGKVISHMTYDPWGVPETNPSLDENYAGIDNLNNFTGYTYDDVLEIYYAQFRFYSPTDHRFVQEDPIKDGLNWYAYCWNNPLIRVDPWGLLWIGDVTLPTEAQAKIETATQQYQEATTKKQMEVAHNAAMAVRDSYITQELKDEAIDALMMDSIIGISIAEDGSYFYVLMCGVNTGKDATQIIYAMAGLGLLNTVPYGKNAGESLLNYYGESICFTVGTQILTGDGYVSIEDVEVGDYVYSCNVETGESGLKQVVNVFINEAHFLIKIYIDGQVIETTPIHPFWVVDEGWVAAGDLSEEDVLLVYDDETGETCSIVIERIEVVILDEPITVYNFEVEDWHTYFVSERNVLVHNANYEGCGVNYGIGGYVTYYRAMSAYEFELLTSSGEYQNILRGERAGVAPTYFTDTYYGDAKTAQSKLALEYTPEYIVEFKIVNNPNIEGGTTVDTKYGEGGGGTEYITDDKVEVEIVNYTYYGQVPTTNTNDDDDVRKKYQMG